MSLLELLEEIYRGFILFSLKETFVNHVQVDNSGAEQRLYLIEIHLKKIDQYLSQIDKRSVEKGIEASLEVEDLVDQFRKLTTKNKDRS